MWTWILWIWKDNFISNSFLFLKNVWYLTYAKGTGKEELFEFLIGLLDFDDNEFENEI